MINLSKAKGYTAQEWDEFQSEVTRCGGIYKYQKNRIAKDIIEKKYKYELKMSWWAEMLLLMFTAGVAAILIIRGLVCAPLII